MSSLRRLAAAGLLAFQVATLAALESVESWRAAAAGTAHVEAAGGNDCPAPHDDARCLICRAGTDRLAAPLPRLPDAGQQLAVLTGHPPVQAPRAPVLRLGGARAPPPPRG